MRGRILSWLNTRLARRHPSEYGFLLGLALTVGILAGFANAIFRNSVHFFHYLVFERGHVLIGIGSEGWKRILLPLLPMTGALLLIPLDRIFPGEVRGYGLPRFLETVNLRGAIFRARTVFAKILAPAATIGTGGSAGMEGPIAQIGGTLGSMTGQALQLGHERIRTLVACGVAAGIAGSFNAPIAGVFFAHEIVLLRSFSTESFAPVVLSAGVGTLVTRALVGNRLLFEVPVHPGYSPWELALFLGLGLVVAVAAVFFIRSFYAIGDRFTRWQAPAGLKAVVGAGLAGGIGIAAPAVMGEGYGAVEGMLAGRTVGIFLFVLALAKIVATGLTLGSGNAGGVFAPSLLIGSSLGAAYGSSASALWPGLDIGTYSLVGMGGFLAAATHAPMTAIFLIFELTHDYGVIIPVMGTAVIGSVASRWIEKNSIDTLALERRGVRLEEGREASVLDSVRVDQVMATKVETLREDLPLRDILRLIPESRQVTFPVVDGEGRLTGILGLQDFREMAYEEQLGTLVVARDISNRQVVTAFPEDTIRSVLAKIGYRDIENVPVVSREDPARLLGMVSRQDVIRAYNQALLGRMAESREE